MARTSPQPVRRTLYDSVTTSATQNSIAIPKGYNQLSMIADQNFRMSVVPKITKVYFYDASATLGARFVELTAVMLDRVAAGTGTTLDAMTTSDFLYLCYNADTVVPGGVEVVMTASVNDDASVSTWSYYKTDETFADISDTDGTDVGGDTLKQTGSVTWTKPSDWKIGVLADIVTDADTPRQLGYWVRLSVGTALDADTEIQDLWGLDQVAANRGYFATSVTHELAFDVGVVGSLDFIRVSADGTVNITWLDTAG